MNENAFSDINVGTISTLAKIKKNGRYLTLPASLTFTSITNAFEFCFEYLDDILDSVYFILKNSPKNNKSVSMRSKRH